MNKKLLTGAVAAAVALPGLSQAAFDDQGMEYITASEGLGGTMRFNIFDDDDDEGLTTAIGGDSITDDAGQDTASTINSLRIFYTGHADLGGGLRSTYYWELRVQDDPGDEVFTEAYDIGIEGPFGKFEMGKINPTAERLVPGGSLDAATGSSDAAPTSDPHANGLRYETNSIGGFEFGVSARLQDQEGDDDTVDDWSIAAKYTLPFGLEGGVAYETKTCYLDATTNVGCVAGHHDDADGWRFGARYGQDNYLLAYEYRTYDNFGGWDTNSRERRLGGGTGASFDTDGDFNTGREYEVHRVAVQAKVDRLTLSANYSIEETEVDGFNTNDGGDIGLTGTAILSDVPGRTFDRDTLGVDASYALGSRSRVILGYQTRSTDVLLQTADVAAGANQGALDTAVDGDTVGEFDEDRFLLRYRIDF